MKLQCDNHGPRIAYNLAHLFDEACEPPQEEPIQEDKNTLNCVPPLGAVAATKKGER